MAGTAVAGTYAVVLPRIAITRWLTAGACSTHFGWIIPFPTESPAFLLDSGA
ncbi:hypothetical protein ACFWJM_02235 [Streptomyces sp. NPDC127077]|uniref:hypothetical protein n=1 Tax=Streptomyces sp. NPDC127077 TaxID=3347131 RepID=UPI0036634F46